MKILHVYHTYPAVFGGVSRVVYDITRELYKKGHKVSVLTTDSHSTNIKAIETENNSGVEIYRVPTVLKAFARTNNIAIPHPSLTYLVKDITKNFDVIHFHGHRSFQKVVVHHYARKYHIPYIVQTHGDLPRIMTKRRSKQIYDGLFGYRVLREASKVIALSRIEAEQYMDMGVPEEKIEVIPNGIDLLEYADLPPKGSFKIKFNISTDKKVILYLGRIHEIKGIDFLVKAYARLVNKMGVSDVLLVIAGPDDGYLPRIQTLVKTLKIEGNVLISGPLYGRDKFKAYVDADVYVLPSRYETFPLTVLEAVACGTPIILTENCGIADYFRDKVGIVVKPVANNLCEALLEMLLDREKQNIFRKNCKSAIKEFGISKTVLKLEEVYERVVASFD